MGRRRSACSRLCLCAQPEGRTADGASRGVHGRAASRRIRRLSRVREQERRATRILLGACPTPFYELAAAGPAPIASEALERIAALYAIEKDIRGRSAEERRDVRQEKSRPILDALEPWLRETLALISQKTKLAEAIRYALSRWKGLTRYIDGKRCYQATSLRAAADWA